MNNPNDKLIIESRSNYAFQLRGKNLSFSEIRNTSTAFFTSLPEGVRNELYDNMCHGIVRLDCEPELNAYMYAYGAMHNAKLKDAFSHLSANFFNEKQIDIIDYGCGQAMGCISYADYLRENNHTQNVRRITLIEPSYIALARAALHSSLLFPNAEIVTINKGFDDLTVSDIEVDSNIPTLHIFSNVLDMGSTPNYNGVFNLGTFSNLVLEISKGYNEYVITEPLFSDFHRDEQADIFISSLLGINVYYEKKCNSGEFVANKNWTCVIKCGCIGQPNVKVSCSHKDSWTWHEFRKLYGKPKLGTFVKSTGETFKSVVFIDESNEANKVFVRFSKLHGELSSEVIIQNKDNICIFQKTNHKGEKYYELELKCYSADEGDVMPNNEIWYTSSGGEIVMPNYSAMFGAVIVSNTYNNGKGVIKFNGKVIEIGERSFYEYFSHCKTKFTDFSNCIKLTSINIPNSVTKIGAKAFSGCLNLRDINIPNSVTKIGESAFKGCRSLTSIFIPNCVTEIGQFVFKGCFNLTEFNSKLASEDGRCLIVDKKIIAFAPAGLTEYIIPNGVVEIGEYAFEGCSLTTIDIPISVTKIGKYAFSDCFNLRSIDIPNGVTEIEDFAFNGCFNLTSVNIPNSVIKIGQYAFSGCQNLISVSIPNSVTKIERCAFSDCSSLKSIDIPYGVFEIGDYAFSGHRVLANIDSANGKVNVRFIGCKSLTSVSIPDSVTKIGRCAFDGCCNLRCINIPNSVKRIEKDAFSGCKKLSMKTKLKILKIRMGL
ncbi:MAG: leucine-rich repeat domain-containing protein [Alistipes sp.]|nr:leucine-rich repeat domain-containing protein [Alistipes sp.]